jgi:hypothetical protein
MFSKISLNVVKQLQISITIEVFPSLLRFHHNILHLFPKSKEIT